MPRTRSSTCTTGIASTLVMMGGKIGSGVHLVKAFDRSLPPVPAYPAELNQVWTNLVDNALSAMGGTGTLTIRTELGLDISYRIVAQRHGGDLRLRSVPGDTWFEVRLPLEAPAAG